MMEFVNGFRMTSHIWKIKAMFQTTNQNIYLTVPDELYFVHRGEGPATAAFLLRQPNLSETKGQSSGTVGV